MESETGSKEWMSGNMALSKLKQFFSSDIWRIQERQLSAVKRLFIRVLRVFVLTLRGFTKDDVHLRASALTFYSLLSIVPVAALGFGIAKGFGFENVKYRLTSSSEP